MRFRSLISFVAVLAVGACSPPSECTAPQPDRSAEITQLKGQLESANTELKQAKSELFYAKLDVKHSAERLAVADESSSRIARFSLDPAGMSKQLSASIDKLLNSEDRRLDIGQVVQDSAYDAFGSYGQEMLIWALDKLVANPAIARNAYDLSKPVIISLARTLNVKYGSVSVVVTKPYEPYLGALAATQGHYCRFELGVQADKKTEKCTKVLGILSDHYGVPMDENIIKVLGIMHRRHFNDTSAKHEGFDFMRYIGREILSEMKKS